MADGDRIDAKIDRIFELLDVLAIEVNDTKAIGARNEAQLERVESRLERTESTLDAHVVETSSGFARVERRLGNIGTRVEGIETHVERIDTRLESIEAHAARVDTRLNSIEPFTKTRRFDHRRVFKCRF